MIATENPIEQHGTYPLPEGQLDRFALSVRVGYPDDERSGAVVRRQLERHPLRDLEQAISPEEVVAAHAVRDIVDDAVVRYAVELVTATREWPPAWRWVRRPARRWPSCAAPRRGRSRRPATTPSPTT